ncbi:hypothetical protein [Pararhodobacter sp.]|uniref:hypothetical protein n=1 Tax=Pararhodobacter sp. TaxID=2127056 RepID=UPI002AFE23CA|nr:hypothetical protein [Pararhodobacter sp.]
MRQNRVDPMGGLQAIAERGAWFGNKGCLHTSDGRIVRGHSGKRWITCVCAFRGRRRELMQPGCYTELFFHDEATAYAAGHRPCAQCRYPEWRVFATLWAELFGAATADQIDAALHDARLEGRGRRTRQTPKAEVPAGAMIVEAGAVVLRAQGRWWRWRFQGYAEAPAPKACSVTLLTPWPLAQMMTAGLPVQIADLPGVPHRCG